MVKFSEVEEDVNRILFSAKCDLLHQRLLKKSAQTCLDKFASNLHSDQISTLVEEMLCLDVRS